MHFYLEIEKGSEPCFAASGQSASLLDGYAPSFCKQNRKRRRGSLRSPWVLATIYP
jgi:hypothetical protein